jgi:hypothetical protein
MKSILLPKDTNPHATPLPIKLIALLLRVVLADSVIPAQFPSIQVQERAMR